MVITAESSIELQLRESKNGPAILELALSAKENEQFSPQLLSEITRKALCAVPAPAGFVRDVLECIDAETRARLDVKLLYHRVDLSAVRDTLTGLLTKAALLNQTGIDELNKKIPGPKLLTYLDVNHMGPPNRFGLSVEVNEFVKRLPQVVARCFEEAGMAHEMYRLGGDEFAIACEDSEQARRILDQIEREVLNLRAEIFPEQDPRVEKVESFARIRDEERKLRDDYLNLSRKHSLADFREWLLTEKVINQDDREECRKRNLNVQEVQLFVAILGSISAPHLAAASAEQVKRSGAMTITAASGRMAKDFDSASSLGLLSALEELVHKKKRNPQAYPQELLEFDPERHLPSAALLEERRDAESRRSTAQALALELEQISEPEAKILLIDRLRALEGGDPAVADVLRFNLVRNRYLKETLQIQSEETRVVLSLDILGFGAINNALGSERADATLRKLCAIAKGCFPEASLVRSGGGEITMFFPYNIPQDQDAREEFGAAISEMIQEMNAVLDSDANSDVRVSAEFLEKQILNQLLAHELRSLQEVRDFLFETFTRDHINAAEAGAGAMWVSEFSSDSVALLQEHMCVNCDVFTIECDPQESLGKVLGRLGLLRRTRDC